MIGNGYWSTGISVRYGYAANNQNGWSARLSYHDGGFCNDNPATGAISTEGTLHTRYVVAERDDVNVLTVIIDTLKADAERLGVKFNCDGLSAHIYYEGDGEDPDWPPPDGWREMCTEQALRLGWQPLYKPQPA